MAQEHFSLKKRIESFKYAFNGLKILVKEEHNSRVHLFAMIFVIIAGSIFDISKNEWIAVIFAVGFVTATELINSAIEYMADFIYPERHDAIKRIKDLAAGAVLISALSALLTGLLIFIPKVAGLF